MGQLSGKTALVTGGNSGIGLATAQRLAAEGAHVFITGRNQKTLDDAVASIGAEATGIRGDVSNLDDLDNVADAIRARGRGLDVVFANAGGGELAMLADVTVEQFANTFQINVGGILFTLQKVLPLLRARRVDRVDRFNLRIRGHTRNGRVRGVEGCHPFARAHVGG